MNIRTIALSGFMFWIALAAVALFLLYPLRQKLRFGIDLVGGTYIRLEVQTDKAVEAELIEKMQRFPSRLKKAQKNVPTVKKVEEEAIKLTFDSLDNAQAAASFFKLEEPDLKISVEDKTVVMRFDERKAKRMKEDAVRSNIEVLNTRLNKLGVEETPIATQGERNIIIELPGVDDPQRAKAIIGKAAKLEFKLVDRVGSTEDDILYELDGELPEDKEIVSGKGEEGGYYLVSKYTDVTGALLKDAKAGLGGRTTSEVIVNFKFNPVGSERFYELTRKNYGKNLAIVLDGIVISAPRIKEPIRGGEGYISGMRSLEESKELAVLLKSGAFVAPVTFEEERQIGPALGAESIKRGLISCLVGLGLLLVFGFFYYSVSGLFAFMALMYNLVLVLFGLYWLRATLTLPGIAGIVLTVGMAIDASILIFERIKEGLASGLTVKRAVNSGFSDVMTVILDANITTLIVAIVLYNFGTGPIKGFAVTMMLGIIATLITGLFFLRSLFNIVLDTFNIQRLRI